MVKTKQIPFERVTAALLDTTQPFSPIYLHRFSDLEKEDIRSLKDCWEKIDPTRRLVLLHDLEDMADADTLMDFDQVALIGLKDSDGNVRAQATKMLWEYDNPKLVHILMGMVFKDPFNEARAAAAAALGKYVYLGELDELPADVLREVEDCLLTATDSDPDSLVQRRALEALGFSGRPEIPGLIRKAYDCQDHEWVASALLAMGRSYDSGWEADVKRELRSPKADIQIEAIRAAGELGMESAKRILLDLIEDESTDSEIRAETIWALSEIGGEQVRETLEELYEATEDDDEAELIDEALDNLTLNEQIEKMDFLDLDLEAEARTAHVIDLSEETPAEGGPDLSEGEPGTGDLPARKSRSRRKKL